MIKYNASKKIFVLVLILCILLSACSKSANKEYGLNPKSPVMLTVWHYYNGAQKTAFDNLVKEFNETTGREKGVAVEVFSQGSVNNLIDMIKNAALKKVGSDKMPDLFASYVDTAKELDDMGLLSAFDEYFSNEEISNFVDSYIEEGMFDKNKSLKIIPIVKSTEVLMINKTEWDKFCEATGDSKIKLSTWEGVAEVSKKYYDYSGGKAFFGRDAMANYILVGSYQLGHELFKIENGVVTIDLNKEAMKKIWNNFYIPFVSGHFEKYGKFASDDAKTGDIIAFVGSSSGSMYFPTTVVLEDEREYPIELLALPLPNFRGARKIAVQQGAGFVMTKSTKIKEYAGTLFLKWLTEDERNAQFSFDTSYIPVKTKASNYNFMIERSKSKDLETDVNVKKTLEVSLEQVSNYELYTSKAINNGIKIRRFLEISLLEKAIEDKKKIEIELGIEGKATNLKKDVMNNSESIVLTYSETSFENWYGELEKELNNLIQGN
jgi:multiple sugar transport system substrate-binding protein